MTHQGCPAGVADAALAAWTQDNATVTASPGDAAPAQDCDSTDPPRPCHRCAAPLSLWVRQGFVRHSLRAVIPQGRRHDHSP